MDSKLFEKLEELYNSLENCDEVVEMISLKEQIRKDQSLSNLLEEYRTLDKYDSKVKDIKSQIINHPLVAKYKKLENELYFTVLEVNNKLNTVVDKKGCHNENN